MAEIGYRAMIASHTADGERKDAFVLYAVGESTLVGEPFSDMLSLPQLVSDMVGGRIGGRVIEIVNLAERGAGAYAQSLRFGLAVARRDRSVPAAVLIYSGHNEPYLPTPTDDALPGRDSALATWLGGAAGLTARSWLLHDALQYLRSLPWARPRAGLRSIRAVLAPHHSDRSRPPDRSRPRCIASSLHAALEHLGRGAERVCRADTRDRRSPRAGFDARADR